MIHTIWSVVGQVNWRAVCINDQEEERKRGEEEDRKEERGK